MAQAFDQALQIHRDEGFVLDDKDIGGDLSRQLTAGFLDQGPQRGHLDAEDVRGVLLGEALKRDQQKGLAGLRRDLAKPLLDRLLRAGGRIGALVDPHRIPDFREQLVEGGPWPAGSTKNAGILNQRLKGGRHIGIARVLTAGQGARVAAQKRQMLGNSLRCRHFLPSQLVNDRFPTRGNASAQKKFHTTER